MKISHSAAYALEHIIRRAYNGCDRGGVVGLAEADFLEDSPLSAAVAVLAPLSLKYSDEQLMDVSDFWATYRFELSHDKFDAELIQRKLKLLFAGDLCGVIAGEIPVVAKKGVAGAVIARIFNS